METDRERQTNDLRLLKIRMGSDAYVGHDRPSKMAKTTVRAWALKQIENLDK